LTTPWERYLDRWTSRGLIDPGTAERIRAFESEQEESQGLRWPVLIAIAFGGLLLGTGVLLFVAAHWDTLAPAHRFVLVLLSVAGFHVAGALVSERFSALSTTFHAVGTVCLGAGIFLAGQIFNLQEHWPGGLMLWSLGAWFAWLLLRDWPQAALAAALTPAWLGGEWLEGTRGLSGAEKNRTEGLLLLSVTYLTACLPGKETAARKALMWIGGLTLIPLTFAVAESPMSVYGRQGTLPESFRLFGWTVALLLPLALAWRLRKRATWMNLIAALWVLALGTTGGWFDGGGGLLRHAWHASGSYVMCALGSVGLILWGRQETRKERINLGVAGFALTVLFFYFSSVMDKLERSASLIGLGLLFLLGGWLLEKTRRRLVARLESQRS